MNKTVKLRFSSSKKCFISLPRQWITSFDKSKLPVFEVVGENGRLFISWGGDSHSCDITEEYVEINGLFANKQRLQCDEEVIVTLLKDVPICSQVHVEPVSVDDWEILELHASGVEAGLLGQLRAVWAGQVVPIWVQPAICVFVVIRSLTPAGQCCLLEERSEVIISPKMRNGSIPQPVPRRQTPKPTEKDSKATSLEQHSKSSENEHSPVEKDASLRQDNQNYEDHSKTSEHTKNNENGTVFSRTLGFVKAILWGENASKVKDESVCKPVVEYLDCDKDVFGTLRVQPYGYVKQNKNEFDQSDELVVNQASNVFINENTYNVLFGKFCKEKRHNFLAILSRLSSPKEKEEQMKKKIERANQKQAPGIKDKSEFSLLEDDEFKTDDVVVRVIVVDKQNSFQVNFANSCNDKDGKEQFTNAHEIPVNDGQNCRKPPQTFTLGDEWGILDGHVMMHDLLRKQGGFEVTGKVMLKVMPKSQPWTEVRKVDVHPLFEKRESVTPEMMKLAIETCLTSTTTITFPLVASQGTMISVFIQQDFYGEFLLTFPTLPAPTPPFFCPAYTLLRPAHQLSIILKDQVTPETRPACVSRLPFWTVKQIDPQAPDISLTQLGGVTCWAETALSHLYLALATRPLSQHLHRTDSTGCDNGVVSGGLLLSGPRGVGKTTLAQALLRSLAKCPDLAHVQVLQCKQLRGKQISSIKKTLERLLSEASWRQPSTILFDDLDLIAAAPSGPEQELAPESLYYARIAQVIKDLLKQEKQHSSRVVILATCKMVSNIHSSLVSSRGNHFFTKRLQMKQPNAKQRREILTAILENKSAVNPDCLDDLDLDAVVKATEGHVARDLCSVVERAIHAHRMVTCSSPTAGGGREVRLTPDDLSTGLSGFTPAALRNVALHQAGSTTWQDVGGLAAVRTALVETLQWPAKYPVLFSSCPLRLRSGLLLYGAPGTGKTLLAGAVATECHLNFISIKGPELLSKYIGASEQAVRDTFIRAQSAKPCILFFDEFDSLAPRRGHDSTGVTDRVVNQLLTQLDGVEGLDGVYVLAATSRPDLIDPALLRPGRLDKALLCGLPTATDRAHILQALTRKMRLAPDVDLESLAKTCHHFTGADLKALLYNAQLEAIHELAAPGCAAITSPSLESVSSKSSWQHVSDKESDFDIEINSSQSDVALVIEKQRPTSTSDAAVCGVGERTQVAFIPSLEEGVVQLPTPDHEKLVARAERLLSGREGSETTQREPAEVTTVISQRHLLVAAETMTPSVSETERRKYKVIYENFVASRGGNFDDGSQTTGKRATLA